ncbi:hypothetical protein JL722_9819 [Aureococcus anophagefferens]|nr:hypothetical protein JL722_9819 [Aureococcus anophagefferens]
MKLAALAIALSCTNVQANDIILDGSGTTNPSKFYWEIMSLFEARAKPPVKMTYRGVGSSIGQYEFMGEDNGYVSYNDFGSGDMPFSTEDRQTLDNGATVLHVPFNLGAMSFFHNVPDSTLPSTGLNLDACIIADIFNAVITTWDHDDIMAINPDFSPPSGQPIVVYHRTHGSSTTKGITQYLAAACPEKWTQVGSTIDWPDVTVAVEGSGEMSSMIDATEYSIGYIDSGHGRDDGLSEVELKNLYGTYQSSAEAIAQGGVQAAAEEAIALGVLPTDPSADFNNVSLHNMPGQYTWPIVAVSYLYVNQNQLDSGSKGPLLYAFIKYILSEDGQALLGDYNFEAAPADMLDISRAALDMMDLPPREDYVISAKRRSWFEYELGEIESEMATADDLATLEATVDELAALVRSSGLIALDGSGTTNPSKFYWDIMSLFEARAKPPVKMTYRGVGSSIGQYEFMGEDNGYVSYNDFGSGDMPFSTEDRQTLLDNGVTVLHVPFNLGAMSFFHNVPDSTLPSTGLNLDACIIADIFNAVITTWDHDDIMAINPDFSPPSGQPIVVYHRTHGSSTTKGITQYLAAACPEKWTQVGSTIEWPDVTVAVEGSGEMSSSISSTEYSIGYIDSGHGHDDGLSEVELKNLYGTYQSSSESIAQGGVQAAAEEAIAEGYTWPIVAVSYLYVNRDQSGSGEKGALLYAFIKYILSEDGQALLGDYNFESAPKDMLDISRAALDMMVLPSAEDGYPKWKFESNTTKGGGQEDYVISGKRRSWFEYELGEIESEMALAEDLDALEEKVDAMTCSCSGEDDDDHDKDRKKIGLIGVLALVIALIALGVATAAFLKVQALAAPPPARVPANEDAGEICLPAIKPSTQGYGDLGASGNNNDV